MKYSHKLIMGDFNFPEINWSDSSTSVSEAHISSRFLENVRDSYFYQHILENTRYRIGQEPLLLDCIFTNEENVVENLHYCSGLGKGDHLVLAFKFNCYITTNPNLSKKLNFAKGNYQKMIKVLDNISWIEKMQGLSLTDS